MQAPMTVGLTRRLPAAVHDRLAARFTRSRAMAPSATGTRAILSEKAAGLRDLVAAAADSPEHAAMLMVTEKLPELVAEQVKAISNLKIDKVTVWDSGNGADGDGRGSTANFLAGLVGSLPPLHELTRQVGIQLPEYLGKTVPDEDGGQDDGLPATSGNRPPAST